MAFFCSNDCVLMVCIVVVIVAQLRTLISSMKICTAQNSVLTLLKNGKCSTFFNISSDLGEFIRLLLNSRVCSRFIVSETDLFGFFVRCAPQLHVGDNIGERPSHMVPAELCL